MLIMGLRNIQENTKSMSQIDNGPITNDLYYYAQIQQRTTIEGGNINQSTYNSITPAPIIFIVNEYPCTFTSFYEVFGGTIPQFQNNKL
jgi:hypothetical protein